MASGRSPSWRPCRSTRGLGAAAAALGGIDVLVHAVAFARPEDLGGRFVDTSREGFHLALDISSYSLAALAREAHARCGGPGVGAIGMCVTGGFALAMAVDDTIIAPVLSQPSLPLRPVGSARNIDISDDDLARVKTRCAAGLQVLGMRFNGDHLVPAERFDFLREQLGDAFISIELPNSAANPKGAIPPHSVVTEHLIDEPGEPTREALDRVLGFFTEKLGVTT